MCKGFIVVLKKIITTTYLNLKICTVMHIAIAISNALIHGTRLSVITEVSIYIQSNAMVNHFMRGSIALFSI